MKLWVDTSRPAPGGWIWARSYEAAKRLLEQNDWDFDVISLDYELDSVHTGLDLLLLIEHRAREYVNYAPFIGIHTPDIETKNRMIDVAHRINTKRLKGRRHRG